MHRQNHNRTPSTWSVFFAANPFRYFTCIIKKRPCPQTETKAQTPAVPLPFRAMRGTRASGNGDFRRSLLTAGGAAFDPRLTGDLRRGRPAALAPCGRLSGRRFAGYSSCSQPYEIAPAPSRSGRYLYYRRIANLSTIFRGKTPQKAAAAQCSTLQKARDR